MSQKTKKQAASPNTSIVLEAIRMGDTADVMARFGDSGKSTLAVDAVRMALLLGGKSATVGTVVFQDPDSGANFPLSVDVSRDRGTYVKYCDLRDSLGKGQTKARIVTDDKGTLLHWEDETKVHPQVGCIAPRFQLPAEGGAFKESKYDWVGILPDGRIVPLLEVLGDQYLWNFRGDNRNGTMKIYDDKGTFLYTLLVTRKRRKTKIVVTMSLRAPSDEGQDKLGQEIPIAKSIVDQRRWMFAVIESYDNGKTWVLSDANCFNGKPKKRCDKCEGVKDEKKLCLQCRFGPYRLPNHNFESNANAGDGSRRQSKRGRNGGGKRSGSNGGRSSRAVYSSDAESAGSGTMGAALREAGLVDESGKPTVAQPKS